MNDEVRCPKCGSNQVTANKKGFSGKKAVGGAILTGGVGLLADTIGSNKIVITCLNCGNIFAPGHGLKETVKKSESSVKLSELDKQLLQLCTSGHKLQAVKLYKEETGIGLKEAKSYVDNLSGSTPSLSANKGCAGVVLAFLILTSLVFVLFHG